MTPEDQDILSAYGGAIIAQELNLIITAAGYGAFLLACFIAPQFVPASVLRRSNTVTVCLLLIFISSAWNIIDECGATLAQVKFGFRKNLNEDIVAFLKTISWNYIDNWPVTINVLLSDFIVCWRAWIFFGDHRMWKVILVIFMSVNIGINIADLVWGDIHIVILTQGQRDVLDCLSTVTSFAVNLVATAMIAYKAWIHYHIMAEASFACKSRSVKLMLLLIESGAIFCILQLLYTVVDILGATLPVEQLASKWSLSVAVIAQIFVAISALYPVAVLIIIHSNNSPVEETFNFTQSRLEAINNRDIPLEELGSLQQSS